MDDIINSPAGTVGGWLTAGTAVLLQITDSFNIADVNPYLTAVTAIGGFIFLVYKIVNMRLRNKILKSELEKIKDNISESEGSE